MSIVDELIILTPIAFALAMDCFSVLISSGITIRKIKLTHALKIAIAFGIFQMFMPIVGWAVGFILQEIVMELDHWIAFGLLTIIGIRMIRNTITDGQKIRANILNNYVLLTLSIATSIDAMAVGIGVVFLEISLIMAVILIGIVTFLLSLLGVFIGKRFGHLFKNRVEAIGGIILIGIGVKILIEHLT